MGGYDPELVWCHTNGVGDGGFKEGMKGPLCAHQLEGCTVWPIFHHTHTHTHTHTHSIHLVGTQKLNVSIGTIMTKRRYCAAAVV